MRELGGCEAPEVQGSGSCTSGAGEKSDLCLATVLVGRSPKREEKKLCVIVQNIVSIVIEV